VGDDVPATVVDDEPGRGGFGREVGDPAVGRREIGGGRRGTRRWRSGVAGVPAEHPASRARARTIPKIRNNDIAEP
jgi:hypothetical protein